MIKSFLFISFFALLLVSCGEKPAEKPVTFKNEKDKLSYVLGAMNAKTIVASNESSFLQLDKNLLIKGFNDNLSSVSADDCMETIKLLFGPDYRDFNKKYVKEGSLCMGRMTGHAFYSDMKKLGGLNDVNLEMVKKGYADGLYRKDSIIPENNMRQIMQIFLVGLNVKNGDKMLSMAKKLPGAQVFPNGIVMLTIKEGTGGFPGTTDDVKVHYILKSAMGDTIQDSHKMKNALGKAEPVPLQLNGGVIQGWSFALPKMRKGGTYRLYVPWDLAYGAEGGKESLCFDIDLVDYAPSGSFVKPNPSTQMGGY